MSVKGDGGVSHATAQWDGAWSPDELSAAASELFGQGKDANFVSWATGTIDASTGNSAAPGGSGGGMGGPSGGNGGGAPSGSFGGPSGSGCASASGMGSVAYHMASFDYAYRCIAAMEWLFQG